MDEDCYDKFILESLTVQLNEASDCLILSCDILSGQVFNKKIIVGGGGG